MSARDLEALSLEKRSKASATATSWRQSIADKYYEQLNAAQLGRRSPIHERREEKRQMWKRSLAGRANGTIDPFYGCDVFDEMTDYAVNFSFPWCELHITPAMLSASF